MRVLNKYTDTIPADAVSIMRPGPWGNPFVIGRDGNRAQVIAKYEAWLTAPAQAKLLTRACIELRDKDLVCCCAPQACHGHVLAKFIGNFDKV